MNHSMWRILAGALLAVSTIAVSANAQAVTNPNNPNQNNQDKKQRSDQADDNKNQGPSSDKGASDKSGANNGAQTIQQRDAQQDRRDNASTQVNQGGQNGPSNQNQPAQMNRNAAPQHNSAVLPGEKSPRGLSNSQPSVNPQGANQQNSDRRGDSSSLNQNNQPSYQPNGTDSRQARRESMNGREHTAMRPNDMRGPDIGLWFNRSARDGLVISDVSTRGPIARLGFREGDRIVSVNGRRVTSEPEFINYLWGNNADRVEVVVLRDGREDTILVEPALLTEDYGYTQAEPLEQFGIVLDDRYDNRIVVWKVIPRSPAYYAGLREGDVISTLSGRPYTSRREFETSVRDLHAGEANLQVRRGERNRDLTVDVPEFERSARSDGSGQSSAGQRSSDRADQSNREQGSQRTFNDQNSNDRSNDHRRGDTAPNLNGSGGGAERREGH